MPKSLLPTVVLLVLSGCCYYVPSRPATRPGPAAGRDPLVRVRLTTAPEVSISSEAGMEVAWGRNSATLGPNEVMTVTSLVKIPGRGELALQDTLECRPRGESRVRVNRRVYRGRLRVHAAASGEPVLVNVLTVEEYLFGVVPCEIGPIVSQTVEAVKAQAVAARSFTLARIDRHRYVGHDLWDSYLRDQEYQGAGRETELARQAVLATRGEVLLHAGKPAEALFHANCGGATGNGFQPFLKGVVDAPGHRRGRKPFCADQPGHAWEVVLSRDSLERAVGCAAGKAGPVKVRSVSPDRDEFSGRVRRLTFSTDRGEVKLSGDAFRSALGLKSQNFEMKARGSNYVITGRGSGHGFGLCQDGAVGMARAGAGYRQILTHYYTGVELKRLY